jgi:hypothetical protein
VVAVVVVVARRSYLAFPFAVLDNPSLVDRIVADRTVDKEVVEQQPLEEDLLRIQREVAVVEQKNLEIAVRIVAAFDLGNQRVVVDQGKELSEPNPHSPDVSFQTTSGFCFSQSFQNPFSP